MIAKKLLMVLFGTFGLFAAAHGQIFISNSAGKVAEYSTSGSPINTSLISGLSNPGGLAVSGSSLYVSIEGEGMTGNVGEYTTLGTPINSTLITTQVPAELAIQDNDLFVLNNTLYGGVSEFTLGGTAVQTFSATEPAGMGLDGTGNLFILSFDLASSAYTVSEFNVGTGALEQSNLITGISNPGTMVYANGDLFISNTSAGTVSEYDSSGNLISASLISGLNEPYSMAVSGTTLYIANLGSGKIGEYTTSGSTINTSLISGIINPTAIVAVAAVPEPSTWALMGLGLGLILLAARIRCLLQP